MSIARRLGLPERNGYVPVAFVLTAFAAGVQVALVVQALGAGDYPPAGKGTLAWSTLGLLAASALLHVPFERAPAALAHAREALVSRRAVILEPYFSRSSSNGGSSAERTNGDDAPEPSAVLPTLSARVHSPLSAGPVIAPGEAVPLTIEAEPEELARELDVTIEVHGPTRSRTYELEMEGTRLTHEETFHEPGAFSISVTLTHPKADPANRTLSGRVSTYREEVGRLFEALKERLAEADLDVGPQSTPREVMAELRRIDAADPSQLADLAVELEVALYGDQEIDRATYEIVHQAIEGLSFETREVTG